MAIPISIADLLKNRRVESERIEFKGNWNPKDVMQSICAFANDINNWGGGYIVIGINENNGVPVFPPTGITKGSVDKISKELLNICNLIEPRYIPVSEATKYEGKDILVLWVPGGSARPYKCPDRIGDKAPSSYYIRKIASSIKANARDTKELFEISAHTPFDDRPNHKAKIEDLRPSLITNYLYQVGSDLYEEAKRMPLEDLAQNMRIAVGAIEAIKPLNVGLLFFNDRPDNFFRYARIEVVDKPDPTGIGMTEKYFYGPLDVQLRDATTYIQNYVIKEKTFKYAGIAEAARFSNWPIRAIEEALGNSVHHRSYESHEPIVVTVTPEQLEILSHPGPDRSISDKDIENRKMVSSIYRNRRIGEYLKELDLVEGRNTGIPRMLRSLAENGSEPPIFETDEERSYFRVIFKIHPAFILSPNDRINDRINDSVNGNSLNALVLDLMMKNPQITIEEMVRALDKSESAINRTIRELKKTGQIIRMGSRKNGYWETVG
jgi:ATP-dependent DNA helicase RecG